MATMKNKVIWQEGLFALPQHFQQQQRHCEYLLTRRLDALGDFFWGFTELSINTELLAQGKIMIDRAAGCMPDGTVFSIPTRICCRNLSSREPFHRKRATIFIWRCR